MVLIYKEICQDSTKLAYLYNQIPDKDKRVNKQKCGAHCVRVVSRPLKECINARGIRHHRNYDRRTLTKPKLGGFFENKVENIFLKIACKIKKLVALSVIYCAAYC